jgi:hypothetical protein
MTDDRFIVEDSFWVITSPTNVPIYDFAFRLFFDCRTPFVSGRKLPGVSRIGAIRGYQKFYDQMMAEGVQLLNSPPEHDRCSLLPEWYPHINEYTPRSRWYHTIPEFDQITSEFRLPVFVKGVRQTSHHQAAASIVRSRDDYERAVAIYRSDSILHWQDFVCREFIALRPVADERGSKIPASFEFRTFWHRTTCLGAGRYWYEAPEYDWTENEKQEALSLAGAIAEKLDCGFLVIDLAMTQDGRWIVIECNDGFESGYAGVPPFVLWRKLLDSLKI